jgi:hypothetical protein
MFMLKFALFSPLSILVFMNNIATWYMYHVQ